MLNNQIEKCILCGKETDYFFKTPISERLYYIDGSGQLCKECWENTYKKKSVDSFNVKEIKIDEKTILLKQPLQCISYNEGWLFFIESSELKNICQGKNKKEALEDFYESILYSIEEYAKCNDDKLSPNALLIKNKLKKYMDIDKL